MTHLKIRSKICERALCLYIPHAGKFNIFFRIHIGLAIDRSRGGKEMLISCIPKDSCSTEKGYNSQHSVSLVTQSSLFNGPHDFTSPGLIMASSILG